MKSIKTKIFIIYLSVIILTVLLIIIFNATLFLKFSIYVSEKELTQLAKDIIIYADEANDEELATYAYEVTRDTGIFVTFPKNPSMNPKYRPIVSTSYKDIKEKYIDGNRFVYKITLAPHGEQRDLELTINLTDGRKVDLGKPIGIFKQNVEASNNFIMIASGISIIIGGVLLYIMVNKQTQPIRVLHRQTEKIADLDFSDRFCSNGKDEIAQLGENINRISDELSRNIDSLQDTNKQLQKDVDILKKLDEMRKEFIATVSHEFKTPIGIIQSYADGIKYGIAETEDQRSRYLDIILDESERMANMVRELTQLMKMDLNEFKIEKEVVNISDLLTDLGKRYIEMMRDQPIFFAIKEVSDFDILVDKSRIIQVMDNYINNALNHTPQGGSITIWVEKVIDGLCINVKNTGSHIDEEKLAHIWDSFYRVDKARSRELGGSGLGLSIVKGIMKAHGGKYGAKNTDDGIIFFIIL